MNRNFVHKFAVKIREFFPACPKQRENKIAEHACLKYSGRVGRSASAKEFSEETIRLAVMVHIRHAKTDYDLLLSKGYDRWDVRSMVEKEVIEIMIKWEETEL